MPLYGKKEGIVCNRRWDRVKVITICPPVANDSRWHERAMMQSTYLYDSGPLVLDRSPILFILRTTTRMI